MAWRIKWKNGISKKYHEERKYGETTSICPTKKKAIKNEKVLA